MVVDEALRPVMGADVRLPAHALNATTSVAGTFTFSGLPTGATPLVVTKAGFAVATLTAAVGVDAGLLRVVLERLPSSLQYVTAHSFEGFIECGLANFAACGIPTGESFQACAMTGVCAGNVTSDRFVVMYEVSGLPDLIQTELLWQSTQPLGSSMDLTLFAATPEEREAFQGRIINDTYGESPVLGTINRSNAALAGIGTNSSLVVGVYGGPYGGEYPCAAGQCFYNGGIVLQQWFRHFTHLFYHYLPPPDWRFSADGSVPPPPG